MVESSKYKTFFDVDYDNNSSKEFAQMRCFIYSDKKKKRVINNEIVKKYFTGKSLTNEEYSKLKKILDGSIYTDRRNLYEHCKLCSDSFERKDLPNLHYKYWNVCIPTFPYFPGGLMLYLKDRKSLRIENIQDLPNEMFSELLTIEKDIYERLYNYVLGDNIVGINILFNQISKSELCIHGHLEPIIKDADERDIGCIYVQERPYDKFTHIINSSIESDKVLKIPEGIKIQVVTDKLNDVKDILRMYENTIKYYFERGKKIRDKILDIQDKNDDLLYHNMVPAATNFVYLTYYKGKYMLSSVPELTLEFVDMDKIPEDSGDLYSFTINRHYTNRDNVFMRNYSPLIRPSIKIYDPSKTNDKVLVLNKKIYRGLNDDII